MQKKRVWLHLFAIAVIAVSMFSLFACNKDASHMINLYEGSYPDMLDSNFEGDELAVINAGLLENATEEQLRTAVLTAYNVANRSRRTADTSLMLQHTQTTNGLMLFNGFELKSGNAWYYQLPTQWTEPLLAEFISYTTVAYSLDGETYYFAHLGSESNPICNELNVFPYATFYLSEELQPYTFEEYKNERRFCLDDQLELCNLKMTLELIDKTSEIIYDAENHVYKVKLVVDCSLDKETMKEWYLQAMLEGNKYARIEAAKCKSRNYYYWYADIEIWDNGYVKSLNYYEKWDSNSSASSEAVSNFKFYYLDDEIMAIATQDPKYTALSEEQQELMTSPQSFVEMYCEAPITPPDQIKRPLTPLAIFGIVFGCVAFAIIVIVVGVEVAVKKGRLPKLAAQREAQKQKRLAKKAAKEAAKSPEQDSGEIVFKETQEAQEENLDNTSQE